MTPIADRWDHVAELDVEGLRNAALTAAVTGDTLAALRDIDIALGTDLDGGDRGALLYARAVALQTDPDPARMVDDATAAVGLLKAAGRTSEAANAAAGAAIFTQRAGRIADAVDHAVEAMVLTAEAGTDRDAARASNSIAILFGQLSAFELAAMTAARAFDMAAELDDSTRAITADTFCYVVVEGLHGGVDLDAGPAIAAARWLAEQPIGDLAAQPVGPTALAEFALLGVLDADPLELAVAVRDDAATMSIRFSAWHQLVEAAAHRAAGDSAACVGLLDVALPALTGLGDEHRVVRGHRERGAARAALGDFAGAFDDARTEAAMARRNQIEQVGRLASQIQRRADLEVARAVLRRRADDLAHEVSTDSLTGVGSRRWFDLELARLTDRTGWGAVAIVDLDRFKRVNDGFGHHVGDRTLETVGRILRRAVRSGDVVGRLGGEEFAVLLAGTRLEAALLLAERIRLDIERAPWHEIQPGLTVTTSVGVAEGPLSSIREVLRAADAALYEAKRNGRNRVIAA